MVPIGPTGGQSGPTGGHLARSFDPVVHVFFSEALELGTAVSPLPLHVCFHPPSLLATP